MSVQDLHPLYGTIAYRMMLAANAVHGWRTVFTPPNYRLAWIRVHAPGCVCTASATNSGDACPVHAAGVAHMLEIKLASMGVGTSETEKGSAQP
jgi:hypothetical protein